MMIVNVPIEPIPMRYSADLQRWFVQALHGKNVIHIDPKPLTKEIREGAFLDVIGTIHYKSQQIQLIAEEIDKGNILRHERVVFIMHDGWFPIDQLAYMRDMLGCYEWKFVGLFRAGTYDRWDQLAQHGMYTWGENVENAWFKIYDSIIVASNYHRNLLLSTRNIPDYKVTIIPWKEEVPEDLLNITKKNWIVFPHRNNIEKLPENKDWIGISEKWGVVSTIGAAKTKRKYYETLAESKIAVSFALQETYGHAMIEAVLLGCIPLVPDRLSYKELYPRIFRYKGESEFKEKLKKFCDGDIPRVQLEFIRSKFETNSREFFNRLEDVIENL